MFPGYEFILVMLQLFSHYYYSQITSSLCLGGWVILVRLDEALFVLLSMSQTVRFFLWLMLSAGTASDLVAHSASSSCCDFKTSP